MDFKSVYLSQAIKNGTKLPKVKLGDTTVTTRENCGMTKITATVCNELMTSLPPKWLLKITTCSQLAPSMCRLGTQHSNKKAIRWRQSCYLFATEWVVTRNLLVMNYRQKFTLTTDRVQPELKF